MKFGRNLPRNQVPEWATSYIKYKSLKKLIKFMAEDAKHGNDTDTAEFFYSLDRNLEDVDRFYNKKYEDAARRLKLLQDRYGKPTDYSNGIERGEMEDLMGALLELRNQLRKLQWYGEVNRRGFIKITKKLDKKVSQLSTQGPYLLIRVDPKQFATNSALSEIMKTINDWLSTLGELKIYDENSPTNSSRSIHRVSSKVIMSLPAALLDEMDQAIRDDDVQTLRKLIEEDSIGTGGVRFSFTALALSTLQRAISCKAKACINSLLGHINSLDEENDIYKRNCIHRLVIAIGRANSTSGEQAAADTSLNVAIGSRSYITAAAPPVLVPSAGSSREFDDASILFGSEKAILLLEYLLDHLRPHQRHALRTRDTYGRMPLHYAAQHGLQSVCQIIIARMQSWCQLKMDDDADAPFWQDLEGYGPLHLSVLNGHSRTTRTLLESEYWRGRSDRNTGVREQVDKSGEILALATKANFITIVGLLVVAGVDLNYQDDQGETALHVAARSNHPECASILLAGSEGYKADTELTENTFGWTPLFLSCVEGHFRMVELLVAAGADVEKLDTSGWTVKEHATLRGHMDIWRYLARLATAPIVCDSDSPASDISSGSRNHSFVDRKTNGTINETSISRISQDVKTFGHRYLTKESMILVSLGTMDARKAVEAVNLDCIPLTNAHSTQLDTALSLVVSANNAAGEPSITDLPVQDNINTEPIVFTAVDVSKVQLLFDIVPTYAGNKNQVVGRGVALLSSVKPSIGTKRISLQGDVTVPIIAATTLEVIGNVNFNFLIITPFTHPRMTITENHTYWKSMSSTLVIGHRGLGKNVAARKSLQLGENTIQSFIAAANLGASYVEFLHVSDGRTPRPSRPASPVSTNRIYDSRRHRSLSTGNSAKNGVSEMSERMKHTRDFKNNGFKGNSRGNFIQAPFTTLEEMLKDLPETIGFNIEMKYPMLFESEEHEMDTYAVELNSFVDTVLTKVYDLGEKRNIIFSSFNPDICLLLSFKQPSIPILFLTDAGTCSVGDIRASSLQEAIRFASRWNLLGIVTAAEPLVVSPRLVKVVKESGLVCVSYGQLNNDPQKVKLQVREGIDAVIVDSVLAIRQGLTGSQSAPSAPK